jgi:hypothetical protein
VTARRAIRLINADWEDAAIIWALSRSAFRHGALVGACLGMLLAAILQVILP